MIEILTKDDVEELNGEKNDQYYIPGELFNGMQYNLIRLEVKWAYVAVLNTLLNKPHYDQDNNAYVKDDSPAIIEMLEKGRITSGHARLLLSLKDEAIQLRYAQAACDKQISVRQLEVMIHNYLKPKEEKKNVKPIVSRELRSLVNAMQRVFATNVKAIGNNTRGRIYLDYYSEDDLDRLIELVDYLRRKKGL